MLDSPFCIYLLGIRTEISSIEAFVVSAVSGVLVGALFRKLVDQDW